MPITTVNLSSVEVTYSGKLNGTSTDGFLHVEQRLSRAHLHSGVMWCNATVEQTEESTQDVATNKTGASSINGQILICFPIMQW